MKKILFWAQVYGNICFLFFGFPKPKNHIIFGIVIVSFFLSQNSNVCCIRVCVCVYWRRPAHFLTTYIKKLKTSENIYKIKIPLFREEQPVTHKNKKIIKVLQS